MVVCLHSSANVQHREVPIVAELPDRIDDTVHARDCYSPGDVRAHSGAPGQRPQLLSGGADPQALPLISQAPA